VQSGAHPARAIQNRPGDRNIFLTSRPPLEPVFPSFAMNAVAQAIQIRPHGRYCPAD
jgi:hypothetical protein